MVGGRGQRRRPLSCKCGNKHRTSAREQVAVAFALDPKADAEDGTFSGYASVFGSLINSYVPTIIEHGAFAKSLAAPKRKVKILYQHDNREPIGFPLELREDDKGLWIRGQIDIEDPVGAKAIHRMRVGTIDMISIGFDVMPGGERVEKAADGSKVRYISEIDLYEISPVTFGADPKAYITEVHCEKCGGKEKHMGAPGEEEAEMVRFQAMSALATQASLALEAMTASIAACIAMQNPSASDTEETAETAKEQAHAAVIRANASMLSSLGSQIANMCYKLTGDYYYSSMPTDTVTATLDVKTETKPTDSGTMTVPGVVFKGVEETSNEAGVNRELRYKLLAEFQAAELNYAESLLGPEVQ